MSGVGFIGGGQIASCLIKGLLADGASAATLAVAERDARAREALSARHPGLSVCERAEDAVARCDTVIVCVKPDAVRAACSEARAALGADSHLLISVAAGVTLGALREWTRPDLPIVRCMPNTPAQVRCAMSVLCANDKVSDARRKIATSVFSAVGKTWWLEDETLMDLVTAVSGGGPAYLFRVMEAFERAAVAQGMPADMAHALVAQTILGGAHLAAGDTPLATLRESVTSKGGVTERGLAELDAADIDALFARLLDAARARAEALGRKPEDATGGAKG